MRIQEFSMLPESTDDLHVGDYFLEGRSMIAQKESKRVGDLITIYVITEKTDGRILYTPFYDRLEE